MILNDKTSSGRIIGRVLLIEENDKYVYNQRTERIEINVENYDASFLYGYLNSDCIRNKIIKQAQGNTQIYVNWPRIALTSYSVPKLKEQVKLAKLMSSLNNLITLHQREYFIIFNIQKAELGNNCHSWEQRKIGELGYCKSGVGFPDSEQGGSSGVPFFKVSDMNNAGNEREMITANNYVSSCQIQTHGWKVFSAPAIFFAKVGAAVLLNRKWLVFNDFLLDNNTMAFSIDIDNSDKEFMFSTFERINLPSLIQTGALPSYNANQVEDLILFVPSYNEQIKIGKFFKQLDSLITLHQRKKKNINYFVGK